LLLSVDTIDDGNANFPFKVKAYMPASVDDSWLREGELYTVDKDDNCGTASASLLKYTQTEPIPTIGLRLISGQQMFLLLSLIPQLWKLSFMTTLPCIYRWGI
jgi:hypothetical protein